MKLWGQLRNVSTAANKNLNKIKKNPLFDKILIANRGEIACRVMKTAKKLGVKTVAVYSDIDRHAMHVNMADEAFCVGAAPSADSYLRMDRIIQIAKQANAQAIHPGYGFLSENPDFAEKISQNGLTFIGPPASAIISMGSKSASKTIMQKANVPVVPGYHGDNQDPEFLKQEANKIGYPVLIKAVKGGGGKGMKIVEKEEDFFVMLESSKREARKSFGNDRVLVEKYLTTPRHVEVQVFCDTLGNAVYLFERDCSVQRRHQKIIEEAPAPNLSEEIRKDLGEKAVAAAKAVNYVGAGTVEFIMDNDTKQFYFMEMNTRLQVEHPVTEMITGTDLVEWQLEVASGNPLPKLQNDLKINGHAFETRIYAENPRNDFLPDTGKLIHLSSPVPKQHVRVETGVSEGDNVSVYYDPMIAKLVVWGPDRLTALKRLSSELSTYQIVGPETNIEFLKSLAVHPEFKLGNVETGFIGKYKEDLLPRHDSMTEGYSVNLILAAAGLVCFDRKPPYKLQSPWDCLNDFRLNMTSVREFDFTSPNGEDEKLKIICDYNSSNKTYKFKVDGQSADYNVSINPMSPKNDKVTYETFIGDCRYKSTLVVDDEDYIHLFNESGNDSYLSLKLAELQTKRKDAAGGSMEIKAPMPSKIAHILVKDGQKVKKGEPLLVLEAMKMEHVMRAGNDGTVDKIKFTIGDMVKEGQILVTFSDK